MSESSEKTPIRGPFPGIGRTRANPKSRASLGTLVTDIPKLLTKLVRDEVEQALGGRRGDRNPRAIVDRASAQVPAIEVAADHDDAGGGIGAGHFGDDIA